MRVGQKVWRRVRWRTREWEEREVIGETSRSWIVGPERNETKIPKRPKAPIHGWAFSEDERDRIDWVDDNRWKIGSAVQSLTDYEKLRAVADIIGLPAPAPIKEETRDDE